LYDWSDLFDPHTDRHRTYLLCSNRILWHDLGDSYWLLGVCDNDEELWEVWSRYWNGFH
jgi:hypothetical protein